jgi:hypothetical protein
VPQKSRRSRLTIALAPLLALIALACWALASPVGASPDDDYHLNSIWCGQGERAGLCEESSAPETEKVPEALGSSTCYAFKSFQSAACQGAGYSDADGSGLTLVDSERGNFDGNYPPVFYATMSIFASDNISVSVIVMRLFNAALFVGVMTLAFIALPRARRVPLVWGLMACISPLAIFLIPSVNPSSWAILSGALIWVSLVGFFETSGKRKIALGALAALGVLIGAGARADSAVYAGLAIVIALVLTFKRERAYLLSAILPVVLLIVAAAIYLSTNQAAAATEGITNDEQVTIGNEALLIGIVLNIPSLWTGILGTASLGWLDTPLPYIVGFLGVSAFAALVFAGLRRVGLRKGIAFAGAFFTLWAFPTYILFISRANVGDAVQPRYLLPILIIVAGVALFSPSLGRLVFSRTQMILLAAVLAVSQSVSLHFNIRRYVTGNDVTALNLDSAVEWWWGFPLSPMGVWIIGSLAFAGLVAILVTMFAPSGGLASTVTGIEATDAPHIADADRTQEAAH